MWADQGSGPDDVLSRPTGVYAQRLGGSVWHFLEQGTDGGKRGAERVDTARMPAKLSAGEEQGEPDTQETGDERAAGEP